MPGIKPADIRLLDARGGGKATGSGFQTEQPEVGHPHIVVLVARSAGSKAKSAALRGWEVIRSLLAPTTKGPADLLRHGHDVFASVKSEMGNYRIYHRTQVPACRTPAEVSAVILKSLTDAARARFGDAMRAGDVHYVISVPASFSALARTETHEAAKLAGLGEVHLIDEPVAALLDFLNAQDSALVLERDAPRTILVYDYGGGTCDLSLVRAWYSGEAGNELVVENLAISEYRRLGGDDVDRAIMQEVLWPQVCEFLSIGGRFTAQACG